MGQGGAHSGGYTRSGGRVVGYELQFLQWHLGGLTSGLSLATDIYTISQTVEDVVVVAIVVHVYKIWTRQNA